MSTLSPLEHRYICVIERGERWLSLNVYTDREVTADELLPLAVEHAIRYDAERGVTTAPEDLQPIGYLYKGA